MSPPQASASARAARSIVAALLASAASLAGAATSASFGLEAGDVPGGSIDAASAHFRMQGCVSEGGVGASSASFGMQSGCGAAFLSLPADDDDGDGVANGAEDAAPNGGDADGDGIADSLQPAVASLPGGAGYVTAIVTGGDCASFASVSAVAAPSPASDAGFHYPYGRVAVHVACAIPGGAVEVDLAFFGTGAWPPSALRGYGPTPPGFGASAFYTLPATFDTRVLPGSGAVAFAHLALRDGALGDATPADGVIDALVGPVLADAPAAAVPVPVLPGALLATLGLLLGLSGWQARGRLRRP